MKKFSFYTLLVSGLASSFLLLMILLEFIANRLLEPSKRHSLLTPSKVSNVRLYMDSYNALDPILGYTFENNIERNHSNGYAILGNPNSSFKIMILGGSTSDTYFNSNNWPSYLYSEIKKRNHDVVIFNGAVGGYNTTQEFIKLSRDIGSIKPHVVISYSGANEITGREKNNLFYHPYQLYLFKRLKRPFLPIYFPNIITFINEIIAQQKNMQIIAGEKPDNYKTLLYDSVRMMESISRVHNANFIHFLQPYLKNNFTQNGQRPYSSQVLYNIENYKIHYPKYQKILSDLNYSNDFSNILDEHQSFFIDDCHLNNKGNEYIATKVYNILKEKGYL